MWPGTLVRCVEVKEELVYITAMLTDFGNAFILDKVLISSAMFVEIEEYCCYTIIIKVFI